MATSVALRRSFANLPWLLVLRVAAVSAAVYGCVVFVIAPLTGHFAGPFEDFAAYLGAARAVIAHTDIYAAFVGQQQNVALSGFDYPPAIALAVAPLALLPSHAAAVVWLLVDVAATFAGAVVTVRAVLPATWPRIELAVLATFLYAAATYNFWHGQMNPVVFLLLALALRSWVRGEERQCGVFIGVAAAIKLAPFVLVLLLLRRRWWRGAAVSLAVAAASGVIGLLVFGMQTSLEYVRSVLPVLSQEDGWLYNQSWSGVVNRLFDHSVLTFQPSSTVIRVVTVALAGASVLAAAWVVRPQPRTVRAPAVPAPERRAAEFGAGVAAMLLAGTLTWYAHDVHLLIPLAAAAALVAALRPRPTALTWCVGAAVVAVAVVAPLLISAADMDAIVTASHTALWWPLLQGASMPALATAALLIALITTLSRRTPPGLAGPGAGKL